MEIVFLYILNLFLLRYIPDEDYPHYIDHTYYLWPQFYNPYSVMNGYNKYPGFYYLFLGIMGFFGIHSPFGIKMVFGFFDLMNLVMISKIFDLFMNLTKKNPQEPFFFKIQSEYSKLIIPLLYWYYPDHLKIVLTGENDVVALFFQLLSFYHFLKLNYGRSSIFLGFGIMFKVFPIFLLIPYSIYFLKHQEYKNTIYYWFMIGLMFLILSCPYIILDPKGYLQGVFLHMSRMTTGHSYSYYIYQLAQKIFIIPYLEIPISILFIIQISAIISFVLIVFMSFSRFEEGELLLLSFISLFLAGLLSIQDHYTTIIRYLPFFLIYIFSRLNKSKFLIMESTESWVKKSNKAFHYSFIYYIFSYGIPGLFNPHFPSDSSDLILSFQIFSIIGGYYDIFIGFWLFFLFVYGKFFSKHAISPWYIYIIIIIQYLRHILDFFLLISIYFSYVFFATRSILYVILIVITVRNHLKEDKNSINNDQENNFSDELFLKIWGSTNDPGTKIALIERLNQKNIIIKDRKSLLEKLEKDPDFKRLSTM